MGKSTEGLKNQGWVRKWQVALIPWWLLPNESSVDPFSVHLLVPDIILNRGSDPWPGRLCLVFRRGFSSGWRCVRNRGSFFWRIHRIRLWLCQWLWWRCQWQLSTVGAGCWLVFERAWIGIYNLHQFTPPKIRYEQEKLIVFQDLYSSSSPELVCSTFFIRGMLCPNSPELLEPLVSSHSPWPDRKMDARHRPHILPDPHTSQEKNAAKTFFPNGHQMLMALMAKKFQTLPRTWGLDCKKKNWSYITVKCHVHFVWQAMFEKTRFLFLITCFVECPNASFKGFTPLKPTLKPEPTKNMWQDHPSHHTFQGLATGLMSPCSSPRSSAAERSPDSVLHTPTGPAPEIMPGEMSPKTAGVFWKKLNSLWFNQAKLLPLKKKWSFGRWYSILFYGDFEFPAICF